MWQRECKWRVGCKFIFVGESLRGLIFNIYLNINIFFIYKGESIGSFLVWFFIVKKKIVEIRFCLKKIMRENSNNF